MRILALVVIPLLFDITAAGSLRTLAAKRSYSFTVETQIDRGLGPNWVVVAQTITGVFRGPEAMSATAGKLKLARRGNDSFYCEDAEWKRENKIKGEFPTLDQLSDLRAPHEEIGKRAPGLAPRDVKEAFDGTECKVFVGDFTKAAATEVATELLNSATRETGTEGTRRAQKGTGARDPLRPKDAKGTIKLLVDPEEEVPRLFIVEVSFTLDGITRKGGAARIPFKITRTVTLSGFDTAELDIPPEVRGRLGLKEK